MPPRFTRPGDGCDGRFDLAPGRRLGRSYEVEACLGGGVEGEVYRVRDRFTGIVRAAKLYDPGPDAGGRRRAPGRRRSVRHAQKLETLRHCPVVLQYLHLELVTVRGQEVHALISELCPGEPMQAWIDRHPGGRVAPFVALTVLHRLVRGLEDVHNAGEYHSDVHTENILLAPRGIDFGLKLIDFYDWGRPTRAKMRQDVLGAIDVLHDLLGGRSRPKTLPPEVTYVLANRRTERILKRFPTAAALRHHLETFVGPTVF